MTEKKETAKKPAAKKPAAKKPATAKNVPITTEPGEKANAAAGQGDQQPADKASLKASAEPKELDGENVILIEKAGTGNQANVTVMVNGRKSHIERGARATVTNAQLAALKNSHVKFEILDSSGDEAADVEGSASAADADDAE